MKEKTTAIAPSAADRNTTVMPSGPQVEDTQDDGSELGDFFMMMSDAAVPWLEHKERMAEVQSKQQIELAATQVKIREQECMAQVKLKEQEEETRRKAREKDTEDRTQRYKTLQGTILPTAIVCGVIVIALAGLVGIGKLTGEDIGAAFRYIAAFASGAGVGWAGSGVKRRHEAKEKDPQ